MSTSKLETLLSTLTPEKVEMMLDIDIHPLAQPAMEEYIYVVNFKEKYGNKEVILCNPVITVYDDYPSPFSSGANGRITKVRVKDNVLEFYHDWWNYGWFTYEEMCKKYKKAVNAAIKLLNL